MNSLSLSLVRRANARDTQMSTRVARACPPLTKSEEKERMLAVYCNCQSNGSDRLRKGPLLAPLFFSHHSPLSELDAGNRGTSYAKSGKGDLPEAKPAHQGEIPWGLRGVGKQGKPTSPRNGEWSRANENQKAPFSHPWFGEERKSVKPLKRTP